ncbi:SLATT domain-containing protein [Haloplanus aerogenes]|nr:SLATT domain-containing protein [Haloplanus aerogenes]
MLQIGYTDKIFFKMSRYYHVLGMVLDAFVVIITALLTAVLYLRNTPETVNIGLAIMASIISFFNTFVNFEKRALEFENAGDAYNSLLKEFRDFYSLELTGQDNTNGKAMERFEQLSSRQRELNELTPATSDLIARRVKHEEVMQSIEVQEGELRPLLED